MIGNTVEVKEASGLVMEAAILAGGLGTRLRSVLSDVPKVLAPVGGRPFLAYLIRQLEQAGVSRTVMLTGYKAKMIESVMGARCGTMELAYSPETTSLDTGGAVRLALPFFLGEAVLVLNGDSFVDVDLRKFIDWYVIRRPPAALVALEQEDTERFGKLRIGKDDAVEAFEEKSSGGKGYINAGIYIISRTVLEQIPPGRPVSLERDIFPALADNGLAAFRSSGSFLDIGTPESYRRAETFFRH